MKKKRIDALSENISELKKKKKTILSLLSLKPLMFFLK